MGIVTKSNTGSAVAYKESDFDYKPSKYTLPVDSPDTDEPDEPIELPYKFTDNGNGPPVFQPKSGLYLENPANIKTNLDYNPQTGNYDITQKIGDQNLE